MISALTGRFARWQWAWLLLAAASLPPAAHLAYQDSQQVAEALGAQLIRRYSLWETDPAYRGTPQAWTRFAAWLLDTDQLMERVRSKHGPLAEQIELDYRRDMALAHGKVVLTYLAWWSAPLALLYGLGWFHQQRSARRRAIVQPTAENKT